MITVYENACSQAALTMKRKTLEHLSAPVEVSVQKIIGYVFDVFEKDRYALLQLINEVAELRRAAQPFSIENLVHRTIRMFFEQHFADVDPAIIARKSYIIDKSVIGVIARYLDEKPDCMNKNEAVAEITEFVTHHAITLSRQRDLAPA